MPILRRFLLVFVVIAALAGFASSRALAASPPDCSTTEPEVVSSAHFIVHYNADLTLPAAITATQAGNLAASAEQAYAAYQSMGFPAPVTGVSGKTDIQVLDLAQFGVSSVICFGAFDFDSGTLGSGEDYSAGSDVFAEIEFNFFTPSNYVDNWLLQGASSWASWKALAYPAASTQDLGPFDMSLDCFDTTGVTNKCSAVFYENLGESRWPFYEYLSERFGVTFISEALQDAQVVNNSLLGLQNALIAHGTTLSATYDAYSTELMAGGWTAPALNVATPLASVPILTGTSTGDLPAALFNVNHLATRYVEIDRGNGDASHACFAATLTITVQIPVGVISQPAFYWNGGTSSVNLAVAGNTATTTVPWDTCTWANKGFLSLPNATTNLDGRQFSVSEHLNVDTTTPANANVPPAPATPFGQVINVPTSGLVPAISVFGPELLTLPAGATQIRLIVESSGEGSVAAAIGSVALGSGSLRPGENDIRFTVPAGMLSTLRRSAAAGSTVLTLTPTSLDGKATGPAVTQKLAITPATTPATKAPTKAKVNVKTNAKAKPKAKPKMKAQGH